ncbi:TPA: transporter [Serratia liquefaciens]|nr:transporter [Serratia liquefaciens]
MPEQGQGFAHSENSHSGIKSFDFTGSDGALLAAVRAVVIDSAPWFFAVDVCEALELTNTAMALQAVDDEDKNEHKDYLGSGRKPLLVNESGLYSLIIKSRKPQAKRFKRWLTADVLPEIRRTGSYNSTLPACALDFTDPAAAARAWADEYEAKNQAIGYVQRQAKYIDHLENLFSDGLTPVQFCKRLNGVNTSKVNAFLSAAGWLYDDNSNGATARWRVYSYARDKYLTETSRKVTPKDKDAFDVHQPILLHKGAVWLYRRYLKGLLPMKSDWNGEHTHDKELAEGANHA